jgi:hypothetical protein
VNLFSVFTLRTVINYVDFDNIISIKISIDYNIAYVFSLMLDAVADFDFLSEIVIYKGNSRQLVYNIASSDRLIEHFRIIKKFMEDILCMALQ